LLDSFLEEVNIRYPMCYELLTKMANEIIGKYDDGSPKSQLYDSKKFRSIGPNEEIFRLFEIVMNRYLNEEGAFKQGVPDLSASALLFDENLEIFNRENGYSIVYLEANSETLLAHLFKDFLDFVNTGKIKRGGYEQFVQKRLAERGVTNEILPNNISELEDSIKEALKVKSEEDRKLRHKRYRHISNVIIQVDYLKPSEIIQKTKELL
jgi:hypothetical protein